MNTPRKRYAIARYLTGEQKQRMVAAQYSSWDDGYGGRRTAQGGCPLGVALGDPQWSPSLIDLLQFDCFPGQARRALATFIRRWDHNEIAPDDLPIALGLED